VKNGTIDAGRTAISINVGALTVQNATLIANAEIPAIQLLHGHNATSVKNGEWNDANVMENCTVYCATGPIFRYNSAADYSKVKYTIKNSVLVTESEASPLLMCNSKVTGAGTYELGKGVSFYYKAGNAVNQTGDAAPILSGEKIETAEGTKSVTVAGKTYEGLTMAYTDGAAPAAPVAPVTPAQPTTPSVPTTGTPDVSVPTTGVSVAALGVMALVSLAGAAVTKKH